MFNRYLYYLLTFFITLSLIITGIIYHHFRLHVEVLGESLIDQLESELRLMTQEFQHVRQDLGYLGKNQDVLNLANAPLQRQYHDQAVKTFTNLLMNKGQYDRIRYINAQGQEILSVHMGQEGPEIIPANKLQNVIDQDYIARALQLEANQLDISRLTLSEENGKIEVPLKALAHFSIAIFTPKGKRQGVLTLDYQGKSVLQHFRNSSKQGLVQLLLLDQESYYLSNPDSRQEWAFMFSNGPQYLFAKQFPAVWPQIEQSRSGIIEESDRLFAYASMEGFPQPQYLQHCGICSWRAIAYVPPDSLKQVVFNEVEKLVPVFLMFLTIGSFILWYILRFTRQRKYSERKLVQLNRIISNERDLFINGPTIVFNWRDQYGWPVDYVSANIQSVLGYPAASFMDSRLSYSSIVAPEYLTQITDDLAQARQQDLKSFELRPYQVVDSHGRRRWLRHFSTVVHEQQGNITHYYGYVNDITQLKQTEEALKNSRNYVHNLLESLPHPTVVIDVNNYHILLANQAAKALYNDGDSIPEGMTCHYLSHRRNTPCEGSDDPCPIQQILQHKKSTKVVHRHFVSAGSEIYVELMSRPVFNEQGEIVQIIESQRDITHHIINEKRLTHQATTDPLTGTYNRFKFDNELHFQLEIARNHARNLGLIMFDLDDFKMINDNFGHDIGDEALKVVAELARDAIRKTDMLARWGGEEFMILLPDTQLHVVEKIAETLRQQISSHPFRENCQLSASFGVTLSDMADSDSDLVKRVDNALYQSKNEGKNRVTTMLSKRD